MRGVNKTILIGNLGQDPEVRPLPNGGVVANLNVATTDAYRDKSTEQLVERTEWHRVVLFNKTAEIAQQYLKKGSKVYIEGRNQTRKWQDQNGQDRYSTEVIANDMRMLDTPRGGQDQSSQHNHGYPTQGQPPQNQGYTNQGQPQQPQNQGYPPQGQHQTTHPQNQGYNQHQGYPQQSPANTARR